VTGNNFETVISKSEPLMGADFLWGAHHPHCSRYDHHLLWIGGHPLCLGCTCVYLGMAIGTASIFAVQWSIISFVPWVLIHLALLVPTVLQPWIQKKVYKILSRTMLGICIASYLISGLFLINPSHFIPLFQLLVILAFVIGLRVLKIIRDRYAKEPCEDCPLGFYPTCEWNMPRLLGENNNLDLIIALQNQDL
jgi:hypothetical protein